MFDQISQTMKMAIGAGIAAVLLLMITLSSGGPQPLDLTLVDEHMLTSKGNAQLNAQAFKRTVYPDAVRVLMGSDSTISPNCPFGDGWASGKITQVDGSETEVKCQTYGNAKGIEGCFTKQDFANKAVYAAEDGVCNEGITSLPKMK